MEGKHMLCPSTLLLHFKQKYNAVIDVRTV